MSVKQKGEGKTPVTRKPNSQAIQQQQGGKTARAPQKMGGSKGR
jgi:hypothetical protein